MRLKKLDISLLTNDDKNHLFLNPSAQSKLTSLVQLGDKAFQVKLEKSLERDEYFIDTHFEESLVAKHRLHDIVIKPYIKPGHPCSHYTV